MSNSLEKETLEEEEEDIDDLLEDYELHRDRRHNIHHIVKEEEKHGRKSDTSSLKEMFKSHIGDFPQHSANAGTSDRSKLSKTSLDPDESPRKDNRINTLSFQKGTGSNQSLLSPNDKGQTIRRKSFEKTKNSGSFQSNKGEHSDENKGDRSGKHFKSFATETSNYEANWTHFGADVSHRLPRKGSFEVDIKKGSKEASHLVYDYILHRSEVGSAFASKQVGKPLINNYLEMESVKSDDVSRYIQMIKSGVLLDEPVQEITPKHSTRPRDVINERFSDSGDGDSRNDIEDQDKEGPDQETLDLLENYEEEEDEETKQEKEKEKEKERIENLKEGLNAIEFEEDKERKSGPLIFNNIFVKFDPKRIVHKKATKAATSKPPCMIVKQKIEKIENKANLNQTRDTSPTKSREESPSRKRTLSSQGNKDLNLEGDSFSKKSEHASSGLEEEYPKEDSETKRDDSKSASISAGGSFINQIQDSETNATQTNQQDKEETKSMDDEILLKKDISIPSLKVLEPVESSYKEEQQSPISKAIEEAEGETERKHTIRVLSKFDTELSGNNANLTLDKMLARNANKVRKSSMDPKKDEYTQISRSMGDIQANENKDLNKIPVPEDSLDFIDTQDKITHEVDSNISVTDCLVVTQNPLISSYKVKITDVVPCPNLTKCLYDTETSKKTYEPTLVKYAPPEFILVGTTLSTVLVYDGSENLKQTLKYNEGPKQAVTTMDYTLEDPEFSFLVVGYSGGHIAVFDLKTYTLVKSITDVHTSKITSIKINQGVNPLKFICCDESGEIFSYQLQKLWRFYKEEHHLILKDTDTFTFEAELLPKEMRVINSNTLLEQEYLTNIWFLAKIDRIVMMNQNKGADGNPFNTVEWTFPRPNDIPAEILPSLSFGKGTSADGKRRSYVLVAWGKILHLVSFIFQDMKISLVPFGYFELQSNVRVGTWLADDTIVVLDDQNAVYCVNVEEFVEGEYKPKSLEDLGNEERPKQEPKAFIYEFGVEKGLKANITFTNIKKVTWRPYKGSVTTSTTYHQVLMMCENKTVRMKIVSAFEYLDILLREKDWLKFLTIGLQMYHLNIKEFHSIPFHPANRRRFFLPFFQDRISKFLYETLGASGNSQSYNKEFMLSLIDFLIALDDTEFLFNHCFRKFNEAGLQTLFIELLEPFIILDKVKNIPNDQLRIIITHYCNQKKSNLMQRFISNLDLSRQDSFGLVNLCLEQNLYNALINICANTEENYITPFVKLINDYRVTKLNRNNEEAQKYGYRCLWYLRLCLEKKIINNYTEEKFEKWKNMITQLMVMIFAPENLEILFEIDADLVTCFVMLFFIGDLALVTQESYGTLNFGSTKQGTMASDNLHFQIYASVKQVLSNWPGPERNSLYTQYFGFFLGTLADLMRYPFLDRGVCVDFADLYINQPTLLSERLLLLWEKIRLREEGKTQKELEDYFDEKVDYDFIAEKRISIILGLLRYCQFTLTRDQVENLIKKSQASNLIDIECFLLTINWNYKKCFETFLSNRASADVKLRVFGWVDETLKTFSEKTEKVDLERKAIEELKLAIIDRLKNLLKIDSEKTKSIIESYLGDRILTVVHNPGLKPELKLDILEKYLKKQEKNFNIDEGVLILHIQLLAESNPAQQRKVKQILQKSNEYPMGVCLDIVKKHSIKDAWAYLEFKQGNISAAINKSYELFVDTLKEAYIRDNPSEKEYVQNVLNDLIEYLGQNTISSESTWFKIIVNIFTFFEEKASKIQNEETKEEFKKLGSNIIDQLLENIFASSDSQDLMRIVQDNYKGLPVDLRTIVLTKLIFHHVHEEFILNYCKSLLCSDIMNFINLQLIPSQAKGHYSLPNCESCNKNFRHYDFIIWFNCGHIYHSTQGCCPGAQCKICQRSPSTIILNTVYNKMNRGNKALNTPPKNMQKMAVEEDDIDVGRSRAATRTFKDSEDQYYNEKSSKLNKYWNRKNQRLYDINDFADKYL